MEQVGYSFDSKEHLHTIDGKALTGTSSVMSIVGKPGLVYWASGEAVKTLGWTPKTIYIDGKPRAAAKEPRINTADAWFDAYVNEGRLTKPWLEVLDEAYSAHSNSLKKAAGKGTDLHGALEDYVKFCIDGALGVPMDPVHVENPDPKVADFAIWAQQNVDKFLWSEVHTYSTDLWVGGITDCGALMKDGKVAIIDFKSAKEAYASHFWQISGYDIQLAENGGFDAKGNRTLDPIKTDLHIVIPFGAKEFKVVIDKDTPANRAAFKAALMLYREKERHEPSYN